MPGDSKPNTHGLPWAGKSENVQSCNVRESSRVAARVARLVRPQRLCQSSPAQESRDAETAEGGEANDPAMPIIAHTPPPAAT